MATLFKCPKCSFELDEVYLTFSSFCSGPISIINGKVVVERYTEKYAELKEIECPECMESLEEHISLGDIVDV